MDHRTYLKSKGGGDQSMCEKRECSEDVEEQVTQDPHSMVKADCLKPHSQAEEHYSRRYNISNSMPSCAEDFRAVFCNFHGKNEWQ